MKAVIFDFDGTLADTIPICIEAFKQTLKKHFNKEMTDDEISSFFGPTEKGIFKNVLGDSWEEGYKDYLDIYSSLHVDNTQVFDGIIDLIEYLKSQNVKIAIVSGKGPESMEISLKHTGLEKYFDLIITGSDNGADKEKHVNETLRILNVRPEDSAYVGDTAYDMEIANKIGMQSIGAAWSDSSKILKLMNERPTFVFTKIFLMQQLLEQKISEKKSLNA